MMDIISAHENDPVVMREACWALCSLSHKFDTNRAKIIRIGGIEILTGILKKYSGNEPIVLWACGAVANIAASKTAVNCSKFMEVGTCMAVVEILQIYMDESEPVLRYVCWAIGNLASVLQLSQSLGECGACEGVVLALMKHIASPATAQLACTAVWHLSKWPDNKKRLEDAGALHAIEQAMTEHQSNAGVIKWITKAKSAFVSSSLFRSLSTSKGDGVEVAGGFSLRNRGASNASSILSEESTENNTVDNADFEVVGTN